MLIPQTYTRGEKMKLSSRQVSALVRKRIAEGEAGTDVVEDLFRDGFTREQAEAIVQDAADTARRGARKMIVTGGLFAAVAFVISIGTYSSATSNPAGGEYLIWWGPIVAGLIAVAVGMTRLSRIR